MQRAAQRYYALTGVQKENSPPARFEKILQQFSTWMKRGAFQSMAVELLRHFLHYSCQFLHSTPLHCIRSDMIEKKWEIAIHAIYKPLVNYVKNAKIQTRKNVVLMLYIGYSCKSLEVDKCSEYNSTQHTNGCFGGG